MSVARELKALSELRDGAVDMHHGLAHARWVWGVLGDPEAPVWRGMDEAELVAQFDLMIGDMAADLADYQDGMKRAAQALKTLNRIYP